MPLREVLVIENGHPEQKQISELFKNESFKTTTAKNGSEALAAFSNSLPDIIITDISLAERKDFETYLKIRGEKRFQGVPILVIGEKTEDFARVNCHELGIDDFIFRPVEANYLLARIYKAIICKCHKIQNNSKVLQSGPFKIDEDRFQVSYENSIVPLGMSEFKILLFLSSRPGWIFTRSQIIDSIRGQNYSVTERSVDVHINGLRKKLKLVGGNEARSKIESIRGLGYRLRA